eukprot:1189139-Alexandrium_andersonii.AAC.1
MEIGALALGNSGGEGESAAFALLERTFNLPDQQNCGGAKGEGKGGKAFRGQCTRSGTGRP